MEDQKKPDEREADTMLAFRIFDADNKGYIDSAELRYILLNMDKRIPTEELNELIVIADLERDRKISYQGELLVYNTGRSLDFLAVRITVLISLTEFKFTRDFHCLISVGGASRIMCRRSYKSCVNIMQNFTI